MYETPESDPELVNLDANTQETEGNWLDTAWGCLSERSREILTRRSRRETLEAIGAEVGLTRERVRQLESRGAKLLVSAQEINEPNLPNQILEYLGDQSAVPDDVIAALLGTHASAAATVLLKHLGVQPPVLRSGPLIGYWSTKPRALHAQLKALLEHLPLSDEELGQVAQTLDIPSSVPWRPILQKDYRAELTELGWVRAARIPRDRSYLWLRQQGEPRTVLEIANVAGASEHATRETMRRDEAFAQVRPEGTWALTDWRVQGADRRYSNAVEVVVEVLRDLGPLDYTELRTEVQKRYPVSPWRVTQCLSSNLIGRDASGLYDLAERGAEPIEDTEPQRPEYIQASGNVVGIEIPVTHDVLRGSGIAVNRWLTWYLGLRTAPSTRYFALEGGDDEVSVRRMTSNSQLSSLRTQALSLGVVEGCKLVLLLRLDSNVAALRHACEPVLCPAD
ncbi:sigma factor-like helix-turn-helix DNA-binding protein [Arthrobacter sp. AD-310]